MLQFLFDTDHLTLYSHHHVLVSPRVKARPPGAVGLSAVTVQEALKGRMATVARPLAGLLLIQAYEDLINTIHLFRDFALVSFDAPSEAQYQQLRKIGLRIGTQDLKIAAVALANNVPLVTRNRSDF